MRIALGQLKINWENKDANLEKLKVCLEDLAGTRIDLLLLPEMSLTGFSMEYGEDKGKGKRDCMPGEKTCRSLSYSYRHWLGERYRGVLRESLFRDIS